MSEQKLSKRKQYIETRFLGQTKKLSDGTYEKLFGRNARNDIGKFTYTCHLCDSENLSAKALRLHVFSRGHQLKSTFNSVDAKIFRGAMKIYQTIPSKDFPDAIGERKPPGVDDDDGEDGIAVDRDRLEVENAPKASNDELLCVIDVCRSLLASHEMELAENVPKVMKILEKALEVERSGLNSNVEILLEPSNVLSLMLFKLKLKRILKPELESLQMNAIKNLMTNIEKLIKEASKLQAKAHFTMEFIAERLPQMMIEYGMADFIPADFSQFVEEFMASEMADHFKEEAEKAFELLEMNIQAMSSAHGIKSIKSARKDAPRNSGGSKYGHGNNIELTRGPQNK